jgi:Mg-chelatase subunit ChlI
MDDQGRDGYTLRETMELPKTLSECMQDVNVHGIKIRHKLKFIVALHNPDGHTSEVRLLIC